MTRKGAVYPVVEEELDAQRKILQELNGWISLTSSSFAAPSMMVTKKDAASGQKHFPKTATVMLEQVLELLEEKEMYPKKSECHFECGELESLGYTVSARGVTPSTEKARAVEIWPETLYNDTQVNQFLGTVKYSRLCMGPEFAEVARLLVDLTKKEQLFIWEAKHTAALRALKPRLINYAVLQIPDPAKPCVLKTDASGFAIQAVLAQDAKPSGFLCKKMSKVEQWHAICDQELLALVRALKTWRRLFLTR
ncbi:hypothetical protein Efla_004897 [Eimeria flavescens]